MNQFSSRIQRRERGASLLEVLVAMSVVAVLFSAAIPTFIDFTVRNRIATSSNDFIAAINLARSEAIRRGLSVSVCASDDSATCSGTWSDGWLIFVNNDADSPAAVDAGEVLIKTFPAAGDGYTIIGDAAVASDITYGPDGAARELGALAVCHASQLEGSRAIIITRLRPRVARDTDDNRVPNIDDGTDMVSCASPSS